MFMVYSYSSRTKIMSIDIYSECVETFSFISYDWLDKLMDILIAWRINKYIYGLKINDLHTVMRILHYYGNAMSFSVHSFSTFAP